MSRTGEVVKKYFKIIIKDKTNNSIKAVELSARSNKLSFIFVCVELALFVFIGLPLYVFLYAIFRQIPEMINIFNLVFFIVPIFFLIFTYILSQPQKIYLKKDMSDESVTLQKRIVVKSSPITYCKDESPYLSLVDMPVISEKTGLYWMAIGSRADKNKIYTLVLGGRVGLGVIEGSGNWLVGQKEADQIASILGMELDKNIMTWKEGLFMKFGKGSWKITTIILLILAALFACGICAGTYFTKSMDIIDQHQYNFKQ